MIRDLFFSSIAGDYTYRFSQVPTGTAAVDVVLVVSITQGSRDHQRWLQIAVPFLEARLNQLGIGTNALTRNRYSLVQFGGSGSSRFLTVSNQVFFPATSFVHARRQLVRQGQTADGYQAIDFAVKNAPFRTDPNVARLLVFVSNVRRSPLSTHGNLTRTIMESMLRENNILFSSVVSVNMTVDREGGSGLIPVLGLIGRNEGVVAGNNYTYGTANGHVVTTSSVERIVDDYLNLTLDIGGMPWSLDSLARENVTIIRSFLGAVTMEFELRGVQTEEVCERCECEEREEEGGCEATACEVAADQEVCGCLARNSAGEVSVSGDITAPDCHGYQNHSRHWTLLIYFSSGRLVKYDTVKPVQSSSLNRSA